MGLHGHQKVHVEAVEALVEQKNAEIEALSKALKEWGDVATPRISTIVEQADEQAAEELQV